jgi:hypothetical protein
MKCNSITKKGICCKNQSVYNGLCHIHTDYDLEPGETKTTVINHIKSVEGVPTIIDYDIIQPGSLEHIQSEQNFVNKIKGWFWCKKKKEDKFIYLSTSTNESNFCADMLVFDGVMNNNLSNYVYGWLEGGSLGVVGGAIVVVGGLMSGSYLDIASGLLSILTGE